MDIEHVTHGEDHQDERQDDRDDHDDLFFIGSIVFSDDQFIAGIFYGFGHRLFICGILIKGDCDFVFQKIHLAFRHARQFFQSLFNVAFADDTGHSFYFISLFHIYPPWVYSFYHL